MAAPNYALLQQDATDFLLAQYAIDPVVAEATVNGALTKLLTDLGNNVTHPMTSTDASVPISMLNLTLPVAIILADIYAQSPSLAADNTALVNIANTLGHGFHVDDGAAVVGSVVINDVAITEGNNGTQLAIFTVTRTGGTAAFDVNFATQDGTATVADNDYLATAGTLHFLANQNTQTIAVAINGDTKVELNETFSVLLSGATNGATIGHNPGIGIIINDDAAAVAGSVVINDVAITEGNNGTQLAIFTVTRTGGTAAFDVNFATQDGTATVADNDYLATAGTLHFLANQNTQTIAVPIVGDTKAEPNETFNVLLSGATNGATIGHNPGAGIIVNDDAVAIAGSVAVNDVAITEGNNGTQLAIFTVTRTGGTAAFDVNFATQDGTATVADNDYLATAGTLHFLANQNTQTIAVPIVGDTKAEPNETFNVLLSGATNGATIGRNPGVGIIVNDDAVAVAGSVAVNDVAITEGNNGTQLAIFTVTRTGGTAAFDVNFATQDGTATVADNDYLATAGTLHFLANQNTQTIAVPIVGDTKAEPNEIFNVLLSGATNGATIGRNPGVGIIVNDDAAAVAGSIAINDVAITEGNNGTQLAIFTVTRTGGTAAFDVNFATQDGTATVADNDYLATAGTLHFLANQNTQTIAVPIVGDTKAEPNETFNVLLSGATNGATIGRNPGVGIIVNDDAAAVANLVGVASDWPGAHFA